MKEKDRRVGAGRKPGAQAETRVGLPGEVAQAPHIERLDRCVLVVTPREPLVDWVRRLAARRHPPNDTEPFTLEEARAYHRTAYLVPAAEDPHDIEGWIEENFDLVFEQQLFSLESDRRRWPRIRTLDTFVDWFDMELLDAPIDLVDAPLTARMERPSP